jgi:dihydrofolate reductase
MAKVVSTLFISADGVAEIDPAWHFPYFDENMGRAVGEDYNTADVLLIGRETYDSFAGAWPVREADRRHAQGRRLASAARVLLAELGADPG